jgi:DNA-binding NarL/FixJ family response regulator
VKALVVAREPLLREGLSLLVGDVVTVVARLADIDELSDDEGLDVVLVHVASVDDAVVAGSKAGSRRIVAVHDGLTTGEVSRARAAGVSVLVDTSSSPATLRAALVEPDARSRLRWEPPSVAPPSLTPRERSVLTATAAGKTSATIAAESGVSVRTVEKVKQRVVERLGAQNGAHAVAIAVQAGIIVPAAGGASEGERR